MSFVDAGSGNPSSGSVDAMDVRHCSPHNNAGIHMTTGDFWAGFVRCTTPGDVIRGLQVDS